MEMKNVLELLFPRRCLVCRARLHYGSHNVICESCRDDVKSVGEQLCVSCGCELPKRGRRENGWCGACLQHPPHYTTARSVFLYEPPLPALLKAFKFDHDMVSLTGLKELLGDRNFGEYEECDLIIPVPLHNKRLRERGYNQSLLLAKTFFPGCLDKISTNILLRDRYTIPQTTLSGDKRRKNLVGAFVVHSQDELVGKSICLVDDVYTTGTTVNACSKVLRDAGAASVSVLTLARVKISR